MREDRLAHGDTEASEEEEAVVASGTASSERVVVGVMSVWCAEMRDLDDDDEKAAAKWKGI